MSSEDLKSIASKFLSVGKHRIHLCNKLFNSLADLNKLWLEIEDHGLFVIDKDSSDDFVFFEVIPQETVWNFSLKEFCASISSVSDSIYLYKNLHKKGNSTMSEISFENPSFSKQDIKELSTKGSHAIFLDDFTFRNNETCQLFLTNIFNWIESDDLMVINKTCVGCSNNCHFDVVDKDSLSSLSLREFTEAVGISDEIYIYEDHDSDEARMCDFCRLEQIETDKDLEFEFKSSHPLLLTNATIPYFTSMLNKSVNFYYGLLPGDRPLVWLRFKRMRVSNSNIILKAL